MSSDNPLPIGSAIRALKLEYKSLQEQPVEGFQVHLPDEANIFEWEVAIFGPPDTLYEGGYFKARLRFPKDYPYSPPVIRFTNKFWHPNVYATGGLCISILHPQGNDPTTDLKASEKWSPAQNVRTVLLSVISLLNEPNTVSPANAEACRMYKRWRETNGHHNEYEETVKKQVEESKALAQKEGVVVPVTVDEYCKLGQSRVDEKQYDDIIETMDYYIDNDDDYEDDDDDDDEDDDDDDDEDDDDDDDDDDEDDDDDDDEDDGDDADINEDYDDEEETFESTSEIESEDADTDEKGEDGDDEEDNEVDSDADCISESD